MKSFHGLQYEVRGFFTRGMHKYVELYGPTNSKSYGLKMRPKVRHKRLDKVEKWFN